MYTVDNHALDRRALKILAVLEDGDPDDLFETKETAEILDMAPSWLDIGRSAGWGPPYIKLSNRLVRYRRADLIKWLKQRARVHARKVA